MSMWLSESGGPRTADSPLGRLAERLNVDTTLVLALIILAGTGLIVLYSAVGESIARLLGQVLRLGIAFGAMLIAARFTPHFFRVWSPWLYLGGNILLVLVLVTGEVGGGAQRWLDLGFIKFQPSELMKLAVPMMVAWYLADRDLPPRFLHSLVVMVLILVPTALIVHQPDLGTGLLVASSGLFALFLAGLRWRVILAGLVAAGAAAWPVWTHVMHGYQRRRVLTFLNPESDPLGSGYHIIQSKIAIGSGGPFGKGWLNGTQSQLEFLPERDTDFIFAVLGEEFGLVGTVLILILYAFIIGRGLVLSTRASSNYGRLLAGSLTLTFFVYVFVNVGMVAGLLPVVGVPLPLISYGGTSMVTLMAAFGILMGIHANRRLMS